MSQEEERARLVVGKQPVREALRAHGARVSRVLLDPDARSSGVARLAQDLGVPVESASRGQLDRLSEGKEHQGVVAYAPPLALQTLESVLTTETLVLALDGVQDPQNFGATLRSAVGLGRVPVLWGENSSAPLSGATFRASAGAVEHATLCRVASLPHALLDAQARGFTVVGLDAHAPDALRALDLRGPTIVVIGGESRGLSRAVRRSCSALARLVAPRTIDSLNASVSAALSLYEATTQRART